MAQTLQVNPTSLAGEGVMGDLLFIVGTPEACRDGLAFYRAAVRDHPDDPIVRESLGRQMYLAHNYREAADLYGQASRLAPRLPSLAYWQGRSLTALHDREGAIAAFSRTVQIDPEFGDAELRLADLLADAGRTAEATACYQTILQNHPEAGFVRDRIRRLNAQAGVDVR
jgi:tetratricopeptide (TPR) repeat protein